MCSACDASVATLTSGGALATDVDWATLESYGANGTPGWTRTPTGGPHAGRCVAAAGDGSSIWGGSFGGQNGGIVVFGQGEATETTLFTQGLADAFVAYLEPDGALRWATSAGGTGDDLAAAVALVPDGSGSFVAGSFSSTAAFGAGQPSATSLDSAGDRDVFLVRLKP
jgi:hypothetical protein